MTRLLIPPPSNPALSQGASLAQSLRTQGASSTPKRTDFRDALADADERASKQADRQAPDPSEQSRPEPSDETRTPEDEPRERAEPEETGSTRDESAEPAGAEAPGAQAPREHEAPEDETSGPVVPAGEGAAAQAPEPGAEREAGAQAPIDPAGALPEVQPEAPAQEPAEHVVPLAAQPGLDAEPKNASEAPVAGVAPEAPAQGETPIEQTNAAAPPGERGDQVQSESDRRFQALRAPTAEDRAQETIDVATRFDAAIRDRVRNAAKVDLAALASEKLTSPTGKTPGEPGFTPLFERYPIDPGRTELRSEQAPAPQTKTPAPPLPVSTPPPDRAPADARSPALAPVPTTLNTPALPTQAASQTPGSTPATTEQASVQLQRPVISAAPVGAQAQPQGASSTRSFDQAITALRSLGATGRTKAGSTARAAQDSPGARAQRSVLAQVSRGVASVLREQGGAMTIRLRPDTLGELKINLRVQNGGVEATFKVGNAAARDLLKSTLSQLKETLESNGVRVDRLRVELDNARTHDAAGPRAEYRGHQGDGSPGFDDPSETDGREGDSRQQRHGSQGQPHGRGSQDESGDQGAADSAPNGRTPAPPAALDAEASRDDIWIGVDTLA